MVSDSIALCFSIIKSGRGEHGGAAADPAIIVDHPEPRDEAMPRIEDTAT
jgi:hypothetical protein